MSLLSFWLKPVSLVVELDSLPKLLFADKYFSFIYYLLMIMNGLI
jgi:hypothetical protein